MCIRDRHEVRGVSGVRGVDSRLQLGLAEDARPSAGRARAAAAPSTALRRLLDAARSAGVGDENAPKAVGSVLATFAERVPCLLYTSPSPRDRTRSRMPSS